MAGARPGARASEESVHYHANALTRGLSLLEAIADRPTPVTLAEFHQITELPKSTLVRLLSVLETSQYVVRVDDRPAYRLGHRVLPLAQAYVQRLDLGAVAAPHLRAMVDELGQTANVGVLDGDSVLHVCVVSPERSLRFANMAGQRDSLHTTGLGKMLLASLPEDAIAEHLPAEPYPTKTPKSRTTWAALRKELRATHRRGHSFDDNENDQGVRCLAVPILVDGTPLGALSVSGPSAEYGPEDQTRYVAALRSAADTLAEDPDVTAALHRIHDQLRGSIVGL